MDIGSEVKVIFGDAKGFQGIITGLVDRDDIDGRKEWLVQLDGFRSGHDGNNVVLERGNHGEAGSKRYWYVFEDNLKELTLNETYQIF